MFKKYNISLHLVLLFCLGMISHSHAQAQVESPAELTKTDLKLVGKAQFSVLFWDIYESRLYTPSGSFQGVKAKLLFELTYQKNISKKELIKRTREQWKHLGLQEDEYRRFLLPLNALWPDIKKGDRLALNVGENDSDFYFNEKYIGKIEGERFSALFLDIWLSNKTSQPKIRQQLLGDNK